jgi:thiamine kinase-like enzyme
MSDNNSDPTSTKEEKASTTSPGEMSSEVFDSSTYDSMTDSATMNESETNKVLSDTENKQPEAVHTESTTKNTNTTISPTIEGRAPTLKILRESQNVSVTKQLDRQAIQINKKIAQMLQPLQKHIKSADKQSQLTKQIQTQIKQLQKQVSQIQKAVSIGKKKKR